MAENPRNNAKLVGIIIAIIIIAILIYIWYQNRKYNDRRDKIRNEQLSLWNERNHLIERYAQEQTNDENSNDILNNLTLNSFKMGHAMKPFWGDYGQFVYTSFFRTYDDLWGTIIKESKQGDTLHLDKILEHNNEFAKFFNRMNPAFNVTTMGQFINKYFNATLNEIIAITKNQGEKIGLFKTAMQESSNSLANIIANIEAKKDNLKI
jgi:type II secretory pathway pseudopilin PulG